MLASLLPPLTAFSHQNAAVFGPCFSSWCGRLRDTTRSLCLCSAPSCLEKENYCDGNLVICVDLYFSEFEINWHMEDYKPASFNFEKACIDSGTSK